MSRAKRERLEKAVEAYRAETGSALRSLQSISRRLDGLNLILNQTVAGVNTYETANKAAVQSLRADLDWAIRQVKLLAQVEPEREPEREGPEPGKPWADAWEAAGPQGPVATGYLANMRLTGTREPVVVEHPAAPQPVPVLPDGCTHFTADEARQIRVGMHVVNLGRVASVTLEETLVRITDTSGRIFRFRQSDQVWIHR